jgi:hypothetical protein
LSAACAVRTSPTSVSMAKRAVRTIEADCRKPHLHRSTLYRPQAIVVNPLPHWLRPSPVRPRCLLNARTGASGCKGAAIPQPTSFQRIDCT